MKDEEDRDQTNDQENDQENETSDQGLERIQKDLEASQSQATDYLDSLQRLKAEFDNFRKRTLREQSEFLKFAAQNVIGTLLPVLDNFERALTHDVDSDQIDEYREGMQLVYTQFTEALAKEGLVAIEPIGEAFDPTRHEAMMTMESADHTEGTVINVVEKGYLLKDRVIRPAKVSVAG